MTTPTQWAWDVPLPNDAAPTRVVLLALAEFSTPLLPGTTTVRLGVVDPTHPAISETADMDSGQVARHVAALVRADVLIPAPNSTLVRFNEEITAASTRVATTVRDALSVLPEQVPATTLAAPAAATATGVEQATLVEVAEQRPKTAPAKKARAPKKSDSPEDAAAKEVLAWWWEHWTSTVGPVANGAAFSAHAKRVAATMLAEGHTVEAIKDAFVAVDQPRPPEFHVRNHLRGKTRRQTGPTGGSPANYGASQQRAASSPFDGLAGVG